jgi:pimeloyl-ACP methyl ester carboxylesterase
VSDHYAGIISTLDVTPIVIGHSFGGLIAQRLLGLGFAGSCVAIAPAQFRGILSLPLAQLQTAWPVLGHPRLRKKTWSHTPETFHRRFANGVSRAESDELYQAYAIPGPARLLFQTGLANFTPRSEATVDTRRERGPLLLIAGSIDRTVPEATVRAAYKKQRKSPGVTEFKTFPGRGHSLPADHGWRDVADTALDFLARSELPVTA